MDGSAFSSGGKVMQYEFNNRIAAQRAILRVVNRKLLGQRTAVRLSSKAIDRWALGEQD
jgi:hypothetical protein